MVSFFFLFLILKWKFSLFDEKYFEGNERDRIPLLPLPEEINRWKRKLFPLVFSSNIFRGLTRGTATIFLNWRKNAAAHVLQWLLQWASNLLNFYFFLILYLYFCVSTFFFFFFLKKKRKVFIRKLILLKKNNFFMYFFLFSFFF